MKKIFTIALALSLGVGYAQNSLRYSGSSFSNIRLERAHKLLLNTGNVNLESPRFEMEAGANEYLSNGRVYRVLQFEQLPNELQQQRIQAMGIELQQYLPEFAFYAWVPAGLSIENLKSVGVRSVYALQTKDKIHPFLNERPFPQHLVDGNKVKIKVFVEPSGIIEKYIVELQKNGLIVEKTNREVAAVYGSIDPNTLTTLAASSFVMYIEPGDAPVQLENLPGRSDHRSNRGFLEYPSNRRYNGAGVHIAEGDDGLIGPHIDYTGRFVNIATANNSTINHGGHVAGIIMGAGNLDPTTRGMAWGAYLHVYDYYDAMVQAPTAYVTDTVRIQSFSLGQTCNGGYDANAVTADNQMRNYPLMMQVHSAGNSGTSNCNWGAGTGWGNITGGYKQGKNVFTVANLDYMDVIAPSSSRGPATDGRLKPEIAAVGTDVNSTFRNNRYQLMTGTSMACPAITGTFAQCIQAYRVTKGQEPVAGLIKAIMMCTADDLGNVGPDYIYGYGRVNVEKAIKNIELGNFITDSVTQGQTKTFTLNVPANQANLKVMIYWTDPAAAANAVKSLVNDLTLRVTNPASTVVSPYLLNANKSAAAVSAAATRGNDSLNNHELVEIVNPAAGTYTINVTGTQVPTGPQRFWVVYQTIGSNDLLLTYPSGGEGIVPGSAETVRWDDAPNNTSTYTLQLSVDSGATWTTLSSTIPATRRYFNWTPAAAATGNAMMRISRTGASDSVDYPFAIMARPTNITVTRLCVDTIDVTWTPVAGATQYTVYILGAQYMDSVFTTTTNRAIIPGTYVNNKDYWISVAAKGTGLVTGRRANAVQKLPGFLNCTISTDVAISKIVSPAPSAIPGCNSSAVTVSGWVKNAGLVSVNNVPVMMKMNAGAWVTDTVRQPIPSGDSVLFTFQGTVTLSPIGVNVVIMKCAYPGDRNVSNDSVTSNTYVSGSTAGPIGTLYSFDADTRVSGATTCEAVTSTLTNGFYNEVNRVTDDIDWRVFGGSTATVNSGPDQDHTLNNTTGNYIYLEASNCFGKTAKMITPCYNLAGMTNPRLRFWYHMYGALMGELHVDAYIDSAWVLDIMPALVGDKGNSWKLADVALGQWIGKNVAFRFRGITGTGATSDMALDDIGVINLVPPPAPVMNFGSNKRLTCKNDLVQLVDSSLNLVSRKWTVTPAVSFVNGTSDTSARPFITLPASGTYTVKLVGYNGLVYDSLTITSMIRVMSVATVPMIEGFNSGFPPTDWSINNPDGGITWSQALNVPNMNGNSSNAVVIDNFTYTTLGQSDYLMSKPIDLVNTVRPSIGVFEVSYAQSATTKNDTLSIEASIDCGRTWRATGYLKSGATLATTSNLVSTAWIPSGSADWRQDTVDLTQFKGSEVMLRFTAINANGNKLYLDNFVITEKPNAVNNVALSAVSIYPNPSNDVVFVKGLEGKLVNVRILNMNGQVIRGSLQLDPSGRVDLKDFPSGVFIFEITSEGQTGKYRVVKY